MTANEGNGGTEQPAAGRQYRRDPAFGPLSAKSVAWLLCRRQCACLAVLLCPYKMWQGGIIGDSDCAFCGIHPACMEPGHAPLPKFHELRPVITTVADDWLGRMFLDMAARYGIPIHGRKVRSSSLSFIMPNDGKRAIVRCRDDDYLHPFPILHLSGCRALHLDGHQPDAAIHYAKQCREAGIFTSLDGGGLRSNTHELLAFIDVAIVAERLCQQMGYEPAAMLDYLKSRGCRLGGVTLGEQGLVWYDEMGVVRALPALKVPSDRVLDTSGAGDVFHGAYIRSYLANPANCWEEHFRFRTLATLASATQSVCTRSRAESEQSSGSV